LQESNDYEPPGFYQDHGIISTVDVLIKSFAGPPFGVLEVDSTEEHAYDEHDIDFLTGFANVLAEAVATSGRNEVLQATLAQLTQTIGEKDRLLEETALLAQEMQHRIRNNLQLVSNMLNDQLKEMADNNARNGIRAIIQRVMSLGTVYEHLLGSGMDRHIDFGAYAVALCANLPDLHPVPVFPIALRCDPEPLLVNLSTATSLGLVLTELISNSYEHAFPDRGGTIDIRFGRDVQTNNGVIMIADNGIGYVPSAETTRRGVGLARRLMQQVEGTLDAVRSGGTIWTLRFPVSTAVPPSPTA
jgi:two-component sensor histidine kinase